MALETSGTILVIYGMGLPLFSARGMTQTLTPIAAANAVSRSINGVSMDLSAVQFQKYESKISCSDFNTPSFDGIWPGMFVTVDCACELSYPTLGGSPSRSVVAGSTRVQGDTTFYRPSLEMQITSGPSLSYDEWRDEYQWEIGLEESGSSQSS